MASGKIKTSIKIDSKIWQRLKIKCAQLNVDMQDKFEEVIYNYLDDPKIDVQQDIGVDYVKTDKKLAKK